MSTPSTHSRCDVRGGRKRSKAESVVFWQAFWYVVSFLLTWVIYLVGQFRPYFSTNDQGLYAFWIILLALNPLMGFWNAFVYAKPWTWKRKKKEGIGLLPWNDEADLLRWKTKTGRSSGVSSSCYSVQYNVGSEFAT
jgi:hypothetical protein